MVRQRWTISYLAIGVAGAVLGARPAAAQSGIKPFEPIGICGNDSHFEFGRVILPRYFGQRSKCDAEFKALLADPAKVDWKRITEIRQAQIKDWHAWEERTKRELPRFASDHHYAQNEESKIKHETNVAFLRHHENELRARPPTLISAAATVTTFLPRAINEPYLLNPDPAKPEQNRVPQNGNTVAYDVSFLFPNASLVDRMEFQLVDATSEQIENGAELKQVYVSFDNKPVQTVWENGHAVARVPADRQYLYPFSIAIVRHPKQPWFAVKNVKIYGWTLDSFPFDVREKPPTPEQIKQRAIEWCTSGKYAGQNMAKGMEYLARNHVAVGMPRAELEAMVGPATLVDSTATYEAKARPPAHDQQIYAVLRVTMSDSKVQKFEFRWLVDESKSRLE